MSVLEGRIGRFVKAARSLLIMQAAAALLAVALSVWAFVEVRELAAERERLQARVAELEGQRGAPSPVTTAPNDVPPDATLAPRAPPVLIPVPVPVLGAELPAAGEPAPGTETPAVEPKPTESAAPDCSGDNASQPRCRPGRWGRRTPGVQPVAPEAERGGNQQQPQLN
jgi:hypothetical protein